MEPNRREFIKQCAFQKFCNTVLHNEACDAHKELHRHKAREITLIAELFDTSRSTIQYRRTSSFELLKKYLEENADEWDEW